MRSDIQRTGQGVLLLCVAAVRVAFAIDPLRITPVGEYATSMRAVDVSGSYAYCACYTKGLQILDISEPGAPRWVGQYLSTYAWAITERSGIAYLSDDIWGAYILDVTNPQLPWRLAPYGGRPQQTVLGGPYAYVANCIYDFEIYDVSNPARPLRLGTLDMDDAHGIGRDGSYVYLAELRRFYPGNVRIVDVSDPCHPQQVARFVTGGDAIAVVAAGGYAYVADWELGVFILDVSNPAAPALVSHYPTWPFSIVLVGRYAYIPVAQGGLEVIDVSNPAAPRRAGKFGPAYTSTGIDVQGSYIYLATSTKLTIFRQDLIGDLNCDWTLDFGDIAPFVLALGDPEEYQRQYPECNVQNADCNDDGRVDFGDVNPFVELLSG